MKHERSIKLSQWAKNNNYSYGGALKLYHKGGIPHAYQNPETGTISVLLKDDSNHKHEDSVKKAVLYARVSTRKQEEHLDNQLSRLRDYAHQQGYQIVQETKEIASGMNENRKKLIKILEDDSWDVLIVEYKDRLARFGTTWIEMIAQSKGQSVEYINISTDGDEESLVDDITSVLSSFIGRLYGKRGSFQKAKKLIKDSHINNTV